VLRRPELRVPAPEIDQMLPLERGVPGNLRQERREVLLRQPFDSLGRLPHRAILRGRAAMPILDNLTNLTRM
jgi:hypothetical protein